MRRGMKLSHKRTSGQNSQDFIDTQYVRNPGHRITGLCSRGDTGRASSAIDQGGRAPSPGALSGRQERQRERGRNVAQVDPHRHQMSRDSIP